ncbi:hypothetical protein BH09ACT12_BH09ACT12_29820 [soil metagenome]
MPGRPHLSTEAASGRPAWLTRSSLTRKPVLLALAVVAALLVVLIVSVVSNGPVTIATPDLDDADQAACEAFTADLPTSIAGESVREIEPADALGSAYGDPAIIVRCGVPVPADFDEASSSCEVANGVGWYVPPEEFDDQSADVTLTAAGYRPVVEVTLPGGYRPDGPAAAIAQLAATVEEHLTLVENCN